MPRRAAGLAATCAFVLLLLVPALAGAELVDIRPLEGRAVSVAGAERLSDGGALVLATVQRDRRPDTVLVRLRASGLVDRRFGRAGAVLVRRGASAVGVAASPDAHRILAVAGIRGSATVSAFDARGARRARFGRAGSVRLPAATVPVAIDLRGADAVVALSGGPCRACRLVRLDAATGRAAAPVDVLPLATDGAASCAPAAATSVALPAPGRVLVGGAGTPRPGCVPGLAELRFGATPEATAVPAPSDPDEVLVAATAGADHACGAAADGTTVGVWRHPVAGDPRRLAAVPDRSGLRGLTPLPGGGCAVLSRARLHQIDGAGRHVSTRVPAALAATAVVRCRAHLLVIGVRREGTRRRAALAAVGVRGRASAASTTGTGCRG
jgi:hypothetical protein